MAFSQAHFDPTIRAALPADFHWGYATAAAQIEGAWNKDERGLSTWDSFSQVSSRIKDGSTAQDACLSYDLYKEDVALLKQYGVTAYRFSLSWSRIIPLGGQDDPVNDAGIAYYNSLIDLLLENGITPFVTIFHWDLPESLYTRYGGLLDKGRYTEDFCRYARLCFEQFGDRVKHWITYNEPALHARAGFAEGRHAPGHKDPAHTFIVGHTQLVSHGHVCAMYKQDFQPTQKGQIMITLHGDYYEPWDESNPRDVETAQRAQEFEIAWFADPLYGPGECDYPNSMRKQLGDLLPQFTLEEKQLVRNSSEFYGMNSYTSYFVRDRDGPHSPNDYAGNIEKLDRNKGGVERGPESDTLWLRSAPWGFAKLLRWIWNRYQTPIYITENGTTAKGEHDFHPVSQDDILDDQFRIDFYGAYVTEVAKAVQEGIVIKSYFGWTLMDNWEWALGYTARPKKTRYTKRSAYFLKAFFRHLIANRRPLSMYR
ncbi:beta-glucosidase [Thozetella sp. PMI_491]|nr:beta-glucosidase [Thozetella sp. PMI_491]